MAEDKLIQPDFEQEVMDKKELQIKEADMHTIIAKCSGGKSEKFGEMILDQLSSHCWPKSNIVGILESMSGINPKDQVEGMLATQMIVTHNAAMKCFKHAASYFNTTSIPTLELGNATLNSANKLTRTYTMQMEALNRYRGKGQQKMTVEHVHINSGGQAIIGNVNLTKESKEQEEGKVGWSNKK